jgi:hypothetical protein
MGLIEAPSSSSTSSATTSPTSIRKWSPRWLTASYAHDAVIDGVLTYQALAGGEGVSVVPGANISSDGHADGPAGRGDHGAAA